MCNSIVVFLGGVFIIMYVCVCVVFRSYYYDPFCWYQHIGACSVSHFPLVVYLIARVADSRLEIAPSLINYSHSVRGRSMCYL